jgi:hypothetical protein
MYLKCQDPLLCHAINIKTNGITMIAVVIRTG